MSNNSIIIGIDGGATKVSGWLIIKNISTGKFSIGNDNVQKSYREYPEFISDYQPVDIKIQLAEMTGNINLTDTEKIQSSVYTRCAADVVIELLKKYPGKKALVGIGMPGLKTTDKRGIVALANGPRIPEYAANIEKAVAEAGLSLAAPIHHLGSDADYCGLGEEYSDEGLFSDVDNAYYLGGGTGVADAMKLKGEIVPFDAIKSWMAKAWEMKGTKDLSLERYASAGGIQHIYSLLSGISVKELNDKEIYPPQILDRAEKGEKEAGECMTAVAENIAALLYERMTSLYDGWQHLFEFVNPARANLSKDHPYRGTFFDRLIIGQRLGDLMKDAQEGKYLWQPMIMQLSEYIFKHPNENFRNHYLENNTIKPNLIRFSKLREAPAIGAGVDADLNKE